MKLNKIIIILFVLSSQITVGQITESEFQSSETISFIAEMIKAEKTVFGMVSKSGDGWSITADNDEKISSFMLSKEIFKSQNTPLKFGLKEIIVFVIDNKESCYEYMINRERGNWAFYLYRCN